VAQTEMGTSPVPTLACRVGSSTNVVPQTGQARFGVALAPIDFVPLPVVAKGTSPVPDRPRQTTRSARTDRTGINDAEEASR
jgi:hypothetical protein